MRLYIERRTWEERAGQIMCEMLRMASRLCSELLIIDEECEFRLID